jgi:O-antigen ligase
MGNKTVEKFTAWVFLYPLQLATLFVISPYMSDPVNVTKFLAVGLVAFGLGANYLLHGLRQMWGSYQSFFISLAIFLVALLSSVLFSDAPLTQCIYGVYGRNTGLITYIFLLFIAVSPTLLKSKAGFRKLLYGFQWAGIANILYAAWVLALGDPIPWDNQFGVIIGFFGNPDFISAFLGMFSISALSLIAARNVALRIRLMGAGTVVLALYEIYRSGAQQGFVVCVIGIAFILLNLIRGHEKLRRFTPLYLVVVLVVGFAGIAGSLNHGPLSVLHKQSVIFRGWYWHAALKTGIQNPLTGVGPDGFGDWFFRNRSVDAALPSLGESKKPADAAHNIPLDMFASGGFPLLIAYLFIIGIAIRAMVLVMRRSKSYDPLFVAIAGVWIGYQAQSLISLNQIGVASWGWAFTGALVAYELSTRPEGDVSKNVPAQKEGKKKNQISQVLSPQMTFFLGAGIGLLVLLPPFLSDSKWVSALNSHDLTQIESAMKVSYFAPANTNKYIKTIALYDSANLFDQAHTLNLKALEFNPDAFYLWKALYLRSNSTAPEKAKALINLHRLDPLNLDVTAP